MIVSALTGEIINIPIYNSKSDKSVTSLSKVFDWPTIVYYDKKIGHLQTNEIADINKYYDEDYQFFDESEEDDILYKVIDGEKIFRQQHQVDTLLSKIQLKPGMEILDYGCAKGTVLKRLYMKKKDIVPYLFDVSQMYVPLWQKFLTPTQYASYEPRTEWKGKFDLVTSFFAFEHTPDPLKELASIKLLLKPNGLIYMVVPNVYENIGDFIVADHVHHYSDISLRYMFAKGGFEILDIDTNSHFAAYIVVAKNLNVITPFLIDSSQLDVVYDDSQNIAKYWDGLQYRILEFEAEAGDKKSAIYGAGVYGTFIATTLRDFGKINCFIDQNPLLQGKTVMEKLVYSPSAIPEDIEIIYVGLNPKTAGSSIESLNFDKLRFNFYYL
jgi:SAM-dependent methyltransferase